MKRAISVFLQTFLLLVVYAVGSFIAGPFHIQRVLSSSPGQTRVFIWDGILLMLIVYVLILLIEAARKRLMQSALGTTLALILATVIGLVMKLGFITHDHY